MVVELVLQSLMCVIAVVHINYLKESNSQNTTCLEIDGIFLQLKLHVSAYTGHFQVSTKLRNHL